MRGCQDFHFQIFALTDYMHLLGRIDDHSVMLLHMKRTTVVSKEAFSLQAHHVYAPAFQFHRAYQLEQGGIYDFQSFILCHAAKLGHYPESAKRFVLLVKH